MRKFFIRDMDIPENNKVAYLFNTGLTYIYLFSREHKELHSNIITMFIERLLNDNHSDELVYSLTGVVTFKKQVYGSYDSYQDFKRNLCNLIEKFGEKIEIVKQHNVGSASFNITVKLIK